MSPRKNTPEVTPRRTKQKIRYAVVGCGYIAQVAVLPGFKTASANSELVALVSDDPVKLKELGRKYKVDRLCSYEEYDELLASGDIDAVYIALPNDMHAEYTIRAARAGVHVLCEKPMEVNEARCQDMIKACKQDDVRLMIAYRLHLDPTNLQAIKLAASEKLGQVKLFSSVFTMQVEDRDNIRLQAERGGGPLYDIGTYCINAARYLFQAEPVEVVAFDSRDEGDPRFEEVEEMLSVIMRFPDNRLATFICSFGAAAVANYRLVGEKGDIEVDNAYEYAHPMEYTVTIDGKSRTHKAGKHDQFGAELLYFSQCIIEGKNPEPGGEEGLADVRIINALQRSMETGQPVKMTPTQGVKYPKPSQAIKRRGVKKPELVHANPPGEE